jgi:hypothetical protein
MVRKLSTNCNTFGCRAAAIRDSAAACWAGVRRETLAAFHVRNAQQDAEKTGFYDRVVQVY